MIEKIHVAGTDKGDILIYALSTCVWCKKAKSLLEAKGIAYDYIFVDQQEGDDKNMTMEEVAKWNPGCTFPTIVMNGKCIVGFKEEEILENLK